MLKKTLALIGVTLCVNVNAAIIDNGTFTTDTSTGLDWLDVTASQRHRVGLTMMWAHSLDLAEISTAGNSLQQPS